jgi:phosphoglycerate dehydrogenase-like enzyme
MDGVRPRLLVATSSEIEIAPALATSLPDVAWRRIGETPAAERGAVEAILAGSRSLLADFDPVSTPKLRFVQRIFTGVDDFPFDRFPESVQVAGNVGAFAPYVAEQAMALALAAARQLVPAQEMIRAGRLRPPPEQRVFDGSTALVLGYGEIGRAIARRLRPFEVRVVGLSRHGRMAPDCEAMYPAERLDEALGAADLVFDARPLTRATRGSIGPGQLVRMRPTAIYVNVGRAGTVDEEALYRHLVAHPEFRAAMDPWWHENFADGTFERRFPFGELPNFVGMPHSAGYGRDTTARALRSAIANLAQFFAIGTPPRSVDRNDYRP